MWRGFYAENWIFTYRAINLYWDVINLGASLPHGNSSYDSHESIKYLPEYLDCNEIWLKISCGCLGKTKQKILLNHVIEK